MARSSLAVYISSDIVGIHGTQAGRVSRGLDRLRDFPENVRRQATVNMSKRKIFTNVWDALENSPEEAAAMTMRSNVLAAVSNAVRDWNTTQADAARRLGIAQPRLNDLL